MNATAGALSMPFVHWLASLVWSRRGPFLAAWILGVALLTSRGDAWAADDRPFEQSVASVLAQHCVRCHQGREPKGKLDLTTRGGLLAGGESGAAIVPGKPEASLLVDFVTGDRPLMPKAGPALSGGQVAALRKWIASGAVWPDALVLKEERGTWWSLEPLRRPAVPTVAGEDARRIRTPIDAFVLAKLQELGLSLSPEADRRALIRRLSFDLTGLPPAPDEVEAFVADDAPQAFDRLVDRLLDSPMYGERWARNWLDVVHYGDTHGYDKDKRRPNAWPYRDYVIRAFNADRPYARFIEEQLAGDVLSPDSPDGVVATGFVAAGPWDFVGHVELREGTVDKQITRSLDRDDMVTSAMSAFVSLTVHCARCHDHKFDPIPQADYYALQAVFAGVDRADRPYDPDPGGASRRLDLARRREALEREWAEMERRVAEAAGPELGSIEKELDELLKNAAGPERPEFGYHSQIAATPDAVKWVQIDLGATTEIASLVYVGCHDAFNNIGAGFGFPARYRIEVSDDPEMRRDVATVVDRMAADVANPGVRPQSARAGVKGRYVRFTATKLAPRQNDFIFALAELAVVTPEGRNAAIGASVTALDSIEAPVRWGRKNLTDGSYYRAGPPDHLARIAGLGDRRAAVLERAVTADVRRRRESVAGDLERVRQEVAAAAPKGLVYAAATRFPPTGNFTPTNGKPRPIHVLQRGNVTSPGEVAGPGSLSCVPGLRARFEIAAVEDEGARRAALARWIADCDNPLTWRSIVNRVWHYHFGRGIVETPNDFGRMGQLPTHPELLDWLAVEFRDGGGSLKRLHRLIVTSAAYRQRSSIADPGPRAIDAANRFLWRMNGRRLDAEEIRDATLLVSGSLDLTMYGPGYDLFGFEDDHSPRYRYDEHDPDDPRSLRRSVYRFVVRSVPDPLMETLDCADPSLITPARQTTTTALQALALLNNRLMVRQAERFAARVERSVEEGDLARRMDWACRLALSRRPTPDESALLSGYARRHGLANACRLILNMNEFVFID